MSEKTKEINKQARSLFRDNERWAIDSFFRCVRRNGQLESEYGLKLQGQYLLQESGKIFWNHQFYDMDDKTKRLTKEIYRRQQRADRNKLYRTWYYYKDFIIIFVSGAVAVGMLVAAPRVSPSKEKTQTSTTEKKSQNIESTLNYNWAQTKIKGKQK